MQPTVTKNSFAIEVRYFALGVSRALNHINSP